MLIHDHTSLTGALKVRSRFQTAQTAWLFYLQSALFPPWKKHEFIIVIQSKIYGVHFKEINILKKLESTLVQYMSMELDTFV